jgi:hypothetical protein
LTSIANDNLKSFQYFDTEGGYWKLADFAREVRSGQEVFICSKDVDDEMASEARLLFLAGCQQPQLPVTPPKRSSDTYSDGISDEGSPSKRPRVSPPAIQ